MLSFPLHIMWQQQQVLSELYSVVSHLPTDPHPNNTRFLQNNDDNRPLDFHLKDLLYG